MGQQQLLLLVLATVIVGLATVAGINAFEQNQQQATADAMTQEAMRIASDIQAIALKPDQMGGVDGVDNADFTALGQYNTTDNGGTTVYEGPNGVYAIGGAPDSEATDACPGTHTGTGTTDVQAYNADADVNVCVEVGGTGSGDIATGVNFGS
jgi:hypothetical protein